MFADRRPAPSPSRGALLEIFLCCVARLRHWLLGSMFAVHHGHRDFHAKILRLAALGLGLAEAGAAWPSPSGALGGRRDDDDCQPAPASQLLLSDFRELPSSLTIPTLHSPPLALALALALAWHLSRTPGCQLIRGCSRPHAPSVLVRSGFHDPCSRQQSCPLSFMHRLSWLPNLENVCGASV